jgi:membrane fusion protein (multidrug efflux system)
VIVLAALGYFQYYVKPALIKNAISGHPPPAISISTERARTEQWVGQVRSIGTLTAIRGVNVASQVAGLVMDILFESGNVVAEGASLVQLDDAVERADLESNQATLRQTQLDFDRQQELATRNVASESTLEAARAKRDTAAAGVERSKALIAQKNIKAPFAGRLGIRKVDPGQYVSPGTALVSIQALDPIRVDFTIPEQDIPLVKEGQTIELTVDAVPGTVFRGTVEVLDARLNADTRALMVRASLPNPNHKLLPGMFANVTVLTGPPKQVVTVPRTAVTYSLYGDSVFVVSEAEGSSDASEPNPPAAGAARGQPLVAERRPVQVGEVRDDRVAVLDGIAAGDTVVTSGQLKLQSGAHVQIDNSAALRPMAERPKE